MEGFVDMGTQHDGTLTSSDPLQRLPSRLRSGLTSSTGIGKDTQAGSCRLLLPTVRSFPPGPRSSQRKGSILRVLGDVSFHGQVRFDRVVLPSSRPLTP